MILKTLILRLGCLWCSKPLITDFEKKTDRDKADRKHLEESQATMCMCFKQTWTVTMAGYWGKMERIVCSYQPLPVSQIAWWGRIIKNEQSENKTRATWERARAVAAGKKG